MKTKVPQILATVSLLILLFAQCSNPFYSKEDYMKEVAELAERTTDDYSELSAREVKIIKKKIDRLAHKDYERFRPEMTFMEKAAVTKDKFIVQAAIAMYELDHPNDKK